MCVFSVKIIRKECNIVLHWVIRSISKWASKYHFINITHDFWHNTCKIIESKSIKQTAGNIYLLYSIITSLRLFLACFQKKNLFNLMNHVDNLI